MRRVQEVAFNAGESVQSLKLQLEEARQEAVAQGTGSFQRTRRQFEALYAEKIALLEESLATSKQACPVAY